MDYNVDFVRVENKFSFGSFFWVEPLGDCLANFMTELNGHKTTFMIIFLHYIVYVTGWIKIQVNYNFNQAWFFQPRSNLFNLGYYELSKKGFPFFGGCNKKNEAWIVRKDKK